MESDSEDSSEFSGQWTDGWSTRSEADECERIGTESGQSEEVNMTSLDTEKTSRVADEAKAQESSPSMVRSDEELNSSNRFMAGVTAKDLALAEFDSVEEAHAREGLRDKKHFERIDRQRAHKPITRTNCNARFVVHLDKGCGGYHNFHFIKKDLYNYIDEVRRSHIVEGDATAAISYLKGKTELDPLAVVQYTYCAENHLGTNHHRQTIIFEFGLLEDEKIPSYKWLLRCFLDVIRQKELMVVVTDRDESMKKAIRSEFPNATHRLCSWHLARNAVSNIKDANFCSAFKHAVYGNFVVEEFENYWAEMVESFGLENNEWIGKTYEKREHWANAYLCDKFCVGVKKQIESVAALIVLHSESYGTIQKFMLRKFRRPRRVYTVLYDSSFENYECSCKLWNSLGVPCSHIFCAMKELEIEVLPTQLVLRRWCKDAKLLVSVGAVPVADPEKAFRIRYGSL
ncbi:protein FAR1-RELATED SEQUENCE 12-like [Arachis stenosperma]|uniref:protein FAR1-RELATED SEQUENCE 12-like n=1 Tax=Arachis stenosperma TaxID=217475 RepID=UPI0025AC5A62|nr:protein FAR1-RELATED SEQUENCE 12-like [Arachis stenosperma]